jgi:hypothetical protein
MLRLLHGFCFGEIGSPNLCRSSTFASQTSFVVFVFRKSGSDFLFYQRLKQPEILKREVNMRLRIPMVLACALLLAGTAFAGPFALRAPQVAINSSNDGPTADLWDKTADIGGPWAGYSETQFRSEQLWSEVWYTGVDVLSTLVLEIAGNAATIHDDIIICA